MRYLNDDDEDALIELLHEINHRHRPCYQHMVKNDGTCSFYRQAADDAGKGYLTVIDNLVAAKVDLHRREDT